MPRQLTDLEKLVNDTPERREAARNSPGFKSYRPELPPVPQRMRSLPIQRGYPVPWFVAKVGDEYHFPTADGKKLVQALGERLCWVCGQTRGAYMSFVVGPMCTVNRTTSEPPCHHECAVFSAKGCPFLSRPKMKRVHEDQHPEGVAAPVGTYLDRNPGVAAVWTTKRFQILRVDGGILFTLGEPESVMWFAQGRAATRAEVMESLTSGLPFLVEAAKQDGGDEMKRLDLAYTKALALVPS